MIRISTLLVAMIALAAAPYASAVGAKDAKNLASTLPKCTSFLTGNWAGEGTVTEFGPPIQVASTASYKPDGTFDSTTRFLGSDKKWNEQTTKGTWTVTSTASPKICSLTLTSVTASGEGSSNSEFEIIDADTYRSAGIDLKRVR